MMVSEKERTRIRRFVCGQLREQPDLNTLTLGILKRRYLVHVQCESLSPVAKAFMKQVVEEELIKMQEEHDQDGSDLETKRTQNKRKREQEGDEVTSEGEDESTAKKSRCQSSSSSSSSSDSEDIEDNKTGSKEDEQIKSGAQIEEKQMTKPQQKKKGNRIKSDNSSDEKVNDSEVEREENNCSSSEEEVKKENSTGKGEQNKRKSPGQKLSQSDEDSDADNKSERSNKINSSDSSDDNEKEENVIEEKQNNNSDSDSSSLPSLEDEPGTETKKPQEKETSTKKKKAAKKKENTEGQRDDNKAIVRLKRYITLCGVRRNYKKLFEGCKSIRAKVAALKKELEDLGVDGQPTIEKCKKVRMKREEDQELADLDVSNIIATQGRPKRRGTQQEHRDPPSMTYQRALNSCSDSDEESTAQRGPRRTSHWANLQGIISDDADSN